MLKIKANPTFSAKVKITIPGESTPAVLDVVFKHRGGKALADWWQSSAQKPVVDALSDVIESIAGLHDEAGEAVAYTDAALIQLLDQYHAAGPELLDAYFRELTESRAKNSGRPSSI
jgi:hypothetical protein